MEVRGSNIKYRYVDVFHTFKSHVVVDALYIGLPGSNQLFAGVGYQFKPARWLTIAPLLYGGITRESRERGVKVGVLASVNTGAWHGTAYLSQFAPFAGEEERCFLRDSIDVTRVIKSWELGASLGVFAQRDARTWELGPTLKHNDKGGAWAVSVRGGTDVELRVIRVLVF
jgi:hypothetical protein